MLVSYLVESKKETNFSKGNMSCIHKYQYFDMTSFVKKVVAAKIPILLYYGDTDTVCDFLLGQKFSARLGLPEVQAKEPWHFESNIAGFKTVYEGLTFITVRGAGHSVSFTSVYAFAGAERSRTGDGVRNPTVSSRTTDLMCQTY